MLQFKCNCIIKLWQKERYLKQTKEAVYVNVGKHSKMGNGVNGERVHRENFYADYYVIIVCIHYLLYFEQKCLLGVEQMFNLGVIVVLQWK